MRLLNGAEMTSYIKERQTKQVRALRQADHIYPRLAIVVAKKDVASNTYIRLKKDYGKDILVDVEEHQVSQAEVSDKISLLSDRQDIHGIIVQLPLEDPSKTDEIVQKIAPEKDVDGLGSDVNFYPATPTAIDWLLTGYNIDTKNSKIVIVGNGRLVGQPLYKLWLGAGRNVSVIDEGDDLLAELRNADIIVTATGQPGLIKSELIPVGATVVDAGVSIKDDKIHGDVDDAVYDRDDLTITPKVGGVGPLTVAALFENVIRSARP